MCTMALHRLEHIKEGYNENHGNGSVLRYYSCSISANLKQLQALVILHHV